MTEGAANSLSFADRPVRAAGHVTTEQFIMQWDEGADNFIKDPPNATISVLGGDGSKVEDAVVTLRSPKLEAGNLTFEVSVLEGRVSAARSGAAALFIDRGGGGGGLAAAPLAAVALAIVAAATLGVVTAPVTVSVATMDASATIASATTGWVMPIVTTIGTPLSITAPGMQVLRESPSEQLPRGLGTIPTMGAAASVSPLLLGINRQVALHESGRSSSRSGHPKHRRLSKGEREMPFFRKACFAIIVALIPLDAGADNSLQVGTLSCDVYSGIGLFVVEKQTLSCVFKDTGGSSPKLHRFNRPVRRGARGG